MWLALSVLAASAAVLAGRIILDNLRGPWRNAPPGPLFVPLLGSTMSFASSSMDAIKFPLLVIDAMARRHGEVMRLSMGQQHMVFLSGLEAIKEYSSLEETTSRPENPTLLEMYSDGKDLGMGIGLGGARWKEQRRFAEKALGKLGAGKRGMDLKIMQEVEHVMEDLNARLDSHSDVLTSAESYFDLPDLNVIWELVAGIRYDYSDPVPARQFGYLRSFLAESAAGPITATPWLKRVPYFGQIYRGIRQSMNDFRVMIRAVVDDQRDTFDPLHIRGYIDMFLAEQKAKRGSFFTDEDLIINCQDLFIGGSETTSKSLSNCFLRMVLHPRVQARCQEEIDRIVGRERPVTMQDRPHLPYTDATLMEVRRISTPFPITPPRTSHRDLTIDGFTIPAGTPVQMNIYSVLRSEKHFPSPDEFRPERFLDDRGRVFVPEAFIPFGYGKRRCLGENLAIVSNFVFFSNLLQNFLFSCPDPSRPPSTLPCGGLTYGPQPFDIRISRRQ